ncbi:MAG: hypothetical protein JW856_05915 [Dehalococcoidales bacterium]|nr:hypothetical protein [Dehalococcoidales bacterium]
MKKTKILSAFLVLLLITGTNLTAGCSKDKETEYKKYIVSEGTVHFSFEYPSHYLEPYLEANSLMTNIHFWIPFDPKVKYPDIECWICISPHSDTFPNAQAVLEYDLNGERGYYTAPAFKLLQRNKVTMGGYSGEELVFTTKNYDTALFNEYITPTEGESREEYTSRFVGDIVTTTREFYADYGKFWFTIAIYSLSGFETQAQEVYYHIINSFKILK